MNISTVSPGYERNRVWYGQRSRPLPSSGPSEASEHARLAAALRRAGVHFLSVPMGGARGRGSGASMARLGARRGFPDLLIFDPPPPVVAGTIDGIPFATPVGVALELKRPVRGSRPSAAQVSELEALAERGWLATVQWGCDAALAYLRELGYEV